MRNAARTTASPSCSTPPGPTSAASSAPDPCSSRPPRISRTVCRVIPSRESSSSSPANCSVRAAIRARNASARPRAAASRASSSAINEPNVVPFRHRTVRDGHPLTQPYLQLPSSTGPYETNHTLLGYRIKRHQKRGTAKRFVYTYPSKKALGAVTAKVRTISRQNRNQPLAVLLHRLNLALRGWCAYFRYGCSARTFRYLEEFSWRRATKWLRRKHPNATWKQLRRRYLPGWRPTDGSVVLLNPSKVTVIRYRYRGASIPTPWTPNAAPATR